MPRRIRRRLAEHSLLCFVQALKGSTVLVELFNDTSIRGVLDEADDGMNLTMSNVVCTSVDGEASSFPMLFVKATSVRMVHLSATLNVSRLTESHRKMLDEASMAYSRQPVPGSKSKLDLKAAQIISSDQDPTSSDAELPPPPPLPPPAPGST
mmetsp:Transcript_41490/g.50286  ORF Transcript_41490/g.50286 Transcript_41490/m.50286 type:complete len:153 (-) Transcript_41490:49-507(-)|eukprot:CAMPEP_0197854522 /NCGR_PEP_ID=MMETSP1438-20131217/24826_1 /TAXON_ID=1461541 /ORGANISM="Pterosperma sp., Strain CCMP1384" /LENGTH=152 /DNA_ID=CAMNT_0043469287 /DNA_START=154 /DNA_END=612 /DNA_ORIENTATION=+